MEQIGSELAKALNSFQKEVVTVSKDADNPFFKSKYARLDKIMSEALPKLTAHGLAVSQLVDNIDGQSALTTVLMHTSGQSIRSTMPLILSKGDPQGQGSAITYARRYSLAAILGIVIDEDDDGNKASQPKASYTAPTKPTAPVSDLAAGYMKAQVTSFMRASGIADDDMKRVLVDEYGVKDPANMTKAEATAVIEALK